VLRSSAGDTLHAHLPNRHCLNGHPCSATDPARTFPSAQTSCATPVQTRLKQLEGTMQWRHAVFAVIWGPVAVVAFVVSVSAVEVSRASLRMRR